MSSLDLRDKLKDVQSPSEVVSPPAGLVSPPADVAAVTTAMEHVSLSKSEPVVKKGSAGKEVKMTANYVRLEVASEKGMYEYEVKKQTIPSGTAAAVSSSNLP